MVGAQVSRCIFLIGLLVCPAFTTERQKICSNLANNASAYVERSVKSCETLTIQQSLEKSINAARAKLQFTGTPIYVTISFPGSVTDEEAHERLRLTVHTLLSETSVGIVFIIIGDAESQRMSKVIIDQTVQQHGILAPYEDLILVGNFQQWEEQTGTHYIVSNQLTPCKIADVDEELLAAALLPKITTLQKYFSRYPDIEYSNDSLVNFLSIVIHEIMPESVHKVIKLDGDLKFKSDINQLYKLFEEFTDDQIIGIAKDNQPVYRHSFAEYRATHPDTRIGGPPPNGITGYNSGVLLLDLQAMRTSKLYNSLLSKDMFVRLIEKYQFRSHGMGEQDYFTIISTDHEKLFYLLPCSWNRQICVWWRNQDYESVFDDYFRCEEEVHVYHGNNFTKVPDDY